MEPEQFDTNMQHDSSHCPGGTFCSCGHLECDCRYRDNCYWNAIEAAEPAKGD